MITPADPEFKLTKSILQRKAVMNPRFKGIAEWIDTHYGVRTVNIVYDEIAPKQRPRLQVIFEYSREAELFKGHPCGYDPEKQEEVAQQFISEFDAAETASKPSGQLLVIFSAFEPVSMNEANGSIPKESIERLKKTIDHPDLWEISRHFSQTTFFLFKDFQVKKHRDQELHQQWNAQYFELLKPYDEFGYFKPECFKVQLDSKENFDKNFGSNWFYYYR